MAITSAVVTSAADIEWSSGDPFDGYAVFKLVPPTGSTYVVWEDSGLRASSRYVVPVVAGELNGTVEVPYNAAFTPPNSQYRVFFFDKALNQISSGVGLVTVSSDPYTVTVPTLTAPTAESSPPAYSYDPEVVEAMGGFTIENPSGTKDGSNTAFTISRNATNVVIIHEGQVLLEGVGFTRAGTAITAVTPHIPAASANYWAILVG